MKNNIFLFTILLVGLFACDTKKPAVTPVTSMTPPTASAPDERGYIVKVGDLAPNFNMEMIDGSKMELKDLRGKVVVLQFTASWCGVCRKEMPHLEKEVWQAHKDKDFVLIGVDRDEPLEKVQDFISKMGTTYPISLDPNADIFGKFASKKSGVTRNVVIDKKGKIVFLTRLFEQSEFDAMKEKIAELL